MVTACQELYLAFTFFRKVQKAVGPPELSQTDPASHRNPGAWKTARAKRRRGYAGIGQGDAGVVAGSSWDSKLEVFGALATGSMTISDSIIITGSPDATEVPPLPEAPVRIFRNMST